MTDPPASRSRIIEAARGIVEAEGVASLSMRKVAADVGLAPTAIYWHIGGREELLNAVLDDMIDDLPPITAVGATHQDRVASVVRAARSEFLDGIATVQLANEIGRGSELSFRAQVAVAAELHDAGLDGGAAADLLRALLFLVGGFVMIEDQYRQRDPDDRGTTDLWAELEQPDIDSEVRAAMAGPTDTAAVFHYTLDRLLDAVFTTSAGTESPDG